MVLLHVGGFHQAIGTLSREMLRCLLMDRRRAEVVSSSADAIWSHVNAMERPRCRAVFWKASVNQAKIARSRPRERPTPLWGSLCRPSAFALSLHSIASPIAGGRDVHEGLTQRGGRRIVDEPGLASSVKKSRAKSQVVISSESRLQWKHISQTLLEMGEASAASRFWISGPPQQGAVAVEGCWMSQASHVVPVVRLRTEHMMGVSSMHINGDGVSRQDDGTDHR